MLVSPRDRIKDFALIRATHTHAHHVSVCGATSVFAYLCLLQCIKMQFERDEHCP